MKVYVYADESGTFDKLNNEWFVYGGLVLVGSDAKNDAARKFVSIEREIKNRDRAHDVDAEMKAVSMPLRERKRVFKSINSEGCRRFAVIVNQASLHDGIFDSKRRKQCFLDYALKRSIKEGIVDALRVTNVRASEVDAVSVVVDEHSTSTCGKYNLVESINEELRYGTFNATWNKFFPPVFDASMPKIPVAYVDSSRVPLIRAADITANWVYMAIRDRDKYPDELKSIRRDVTLLELP